MLQHACHLGKRGHGGTLRSVHSCNEIPRTLFGLFQTCRRAILGRHGGGMIHDNEQILALIPRKIRLRQCQCDRGKRKRHEQQREHIAQTLE